MPRLKVFPTGVILVVAVLLLALVSVSAHDDPAARHGGSWIKTGFGRTPFPFHSAPRPPAARVLRELRDLLEGQRLFERETFGGNGRTCLTCHSRETGTVSPEDAQRRFLKDRHDPLFVHDGSDDGPEASGTSGCAATPPSS